MEENKTDKIGKNLVISLLLVFFTSYMYQNSVIWKLPPLYPTGFNLRIKFTLQILLVSSIISFNIFAFIRYILKRKSSFYIIIYRMFYFISILLFVYIVVVYRELGLSLS